QDIYAYLLNKQLPQEIFKMIMKHPNTKATILETPRKMNKQKEKQITEVYILRKYSGDLIAKDKELYVSIEKRIDAMLNDYTSKNLLPDIEIINLTEQMNQLMIQDREHYQDPKEEKFQKRIREQKRERTLQITNKFLNKYRTEEITKKKKYHL
ncbi:32037_t:CDS:1, partial [Racocetra persica]